MDISDFGEDDFKERDFGEKDLASVAAAFGLSYEIDYDVPVARSENKSYTVSAWVKMKGLKSKRYAVLIYGKNSHTKRCMLELALLYRKPTDGKDALLPSDVRRVRDEAAAHVVKCVLGGCLIKVSKTRRIAVPRSSSVEELKLKMAVAGGFAR